MENENEVCHAADVLQRDSVIKARTALYKVCGKLLAENTCNGFELQVALADVITHTACHVAVNELQNKPEEVNGRTTEGG